MTDHRFSHRSTASTLSRRRLFVFILGCFIVALIHAGIGGWMTDGQPSPDTATAELPDGATPPATNARVGRSTEPQWSPDAEYVRYFMHLG